MSLVLTAAKTRHPATSGPDPKRTLNPAGSGCSGPISEHQESRFEGRPATGFSTDCLRDKAGLNFSRIVGLRAKGPHTAPMYS